MANPAPCQNCLEVADAEFYVTNRLGVPWQFEQTTVALCVPCFIECGISMGTALQAAIAEIEAQAQAGALEQVEADEGQVRPAPAKTKRRTSKKAAAAVIELHPEDAPETEATDEQQ